MERGGGGDEAKFRFFFPKMAKITFGLEFPPNITYFLRFSLSVFSLKYIKSNQICAKMILQHSFEPSYRWAQLTKKVTSIDSLIVLGIDNKY